MIYQGQATVTKESKIATVMVQLEDRPAGENVFGCSMEVPDEQPYRGQKAGALSGLRYGSSEKRSQSDGIKLLVTGFSGDASPDGFAMASTYATWLALKKEIPSDFDPEGWKLDTEQDTSTPDGAD